MLLLAAACKGESPAAGPPTGSGPGGPATAVAPLPPPGTGVIRGVVRLAGPAPVMREVSKSADPNCGSKPQREEDVVVGKAAGLANVALRITAGLPAAYPAPATEAKLDQSECTYRPHVQVIMAGQRLAIRNADPTLHNLHAYKGARTVLNQAQIQGAPPIVRQYAAEDDVIKLRCDVHPWMNAYVVVAANPYFAVTGDDGAFSIASLPPGTYTVQAWHERYGKKETQVTVADKPVDTSFELSGP